LVGGPAFAYVVMYGLISVLAQIFFEYKRYVAVLKWLTLSLFAYVGGVLLVHIDWSEALLGMIWPREFSKAAVLTIVAVFGTTISPYLFFWQSSQEAEEIATHPGQKPLTASSARTARNQLHRIRIDTLLGMALSNLIALAIMLATAATLHARGITEIHSAADAAAALRPVAGNFASLLFAVGIIGTGKLAVPILAGSAAFAVGETRHWKTGLEYRPGEATRFYAVIVAAIAVGVLLDWFHFDPIKALFWSAVLNGIAAVPIMASMMIVASSRKIMGRFVEHRWLLAFGWAATLVMAAASLATLAGFVG
jgi:Mn2+/Fe2+ NRAMP family transporter